MSLKVKTNFISSTGSAAGKIPRPLLIKKIADKSFKNNIFITAPGGYGKTIAAMQWLDYVHGATAQIIIGNKDNAPSFFYKRLALKLMQLVKIEIDSSDTVFTIDNFIETLAALPVKHSRCFLMIDDLQKISNYEILNSLPFILTHIPNYVCICMISRSAPTKSLLDAGLFEVLTQDELLFSSEEIEYLGAEKDLKLTTEQINDILESTGGWAMYLSALITEGGQYKTPKTLIQFLDTQVWDLWDIDTKKLLIQLSIPIEITPDLCELLTEKTGGKDILERFVKKDNAFLSYMGDDIYRFHDIFLDFLRKHETLLGNYEIHRLNDTAAKWYFEKSEYTESIWHYIRNLDHFGVNKCMNIINYYRAEAELQWTYEFNSRLTHQFSDFLTIEFITENPYLIGVQAVNAYRNSDVETFFYFLDVIHQKLPEFVSQYPELLETASFVFSLDFRIPIREYVKQNIETMTLFLESKPASDSHILTLTQNLPFFHRSMRDFSEYYELRENDLALFTKTFGFAVGSNYKVIKQSLISGMYYEAGDLIKAVYHAMDGYLACEKGMHPETLFSANMILAAVLYAQGDYWNAEKILDQTEILVKNKTRLFNLNFKAKQTEYAIRSGNIGAAKEWANIYSHNIMSENQAQRLSLEQICMHFVMIRSYIALEEFKKAIDLGRRLLALATDYNRPLDQIESGILTAKALWCCDEKSKSAEQMEQALCIAMPYGFIQLFVNEGKEILPLLMMISEKASLTGEQSQFLKILMERIYGTYNMKPGIEPPRLTPMRRKMLEYLGKGMSYNEIADKTGILRGSAKSTILLLYKQLGVHSAEEAVMKAKMMGLL